MLLINSEVVNSFGREVTGTYKGEGFVYFIDYGTQEVDLDTNLNKSDQEELIKEIV